MFVAGVQHQGSEDYGLITRLSIAVCRHANVAWYVYPPALAKADNSANNKLGDVVKKQSSSDGLATSREL